MELRHAGFFFEKVKGAADYYTRLTRELSVLSRVLASFTEFAAGELTDTWTNIFKSRAKKG
jgi:hypothetical protein